MNELSRTDSDAISDGMAAVRLHEAMPRTLVKLAGRDGLFVVLDREEGGGQIIRWLVPFVVDDALSPHPVKTMIYPIRADSPALETVSGGLNDL
mgnify:CR=1 FL=1